MNRPDLSGASDIAAARRMLAMQFEADGIESPGLDARLIVGHALSLDHTGLVAQSTRALAAADRDAITVLAARRLNGEPMARILGVKEFWGLPFALSAATLVPRPDTETIVEAALEAIGRMRRDDALRIADLGTGSGAILLALLHEWPNATGVGTDIDPQALATAQTNAQTFGVDARAEFRNSRFDDDPGEAFDLVVSNPPYIPTGDLATLQREVREHDPLPALDGGADGLACYRAIAGKVSQLLRPAGVLVLELGAGQGDDVVAILNAAGCLDVTGIRPDLGGISRAVTARLKPC